MQFTIITPSFNQLSHLERCVASVRDQVGSHSEPVDRCLVEVDGKFAGNHQSPIALSVHHHVQDGGSSDGTKEWLAEYAVQQPITDNHQLSFASEADEGMYDAINRGVAFVGARGQSNQQPITRDSRDSVIAWLNCDEQYLPHTLGKVAAFFASHPETDLLFGGMLVVDGAGKLLSCRKAMPMRRMFLEASYLYNYSCAMFFRESLWRRLGGFDLDFRNAGDEDWVRRALRLGAKTAVLDEYLATFAWSEGNLSSDPSAVEEHERLKAQNARWVNGFRVPLNLLRLAEKFVRGGHIQKASIEYAIYADSLEHRTRFVSDRPSCRWPGENRPYLTKHRLDGG